MTVLYFLVPLALLLAGGAGLAFRWAANSEQFEDLESPAVRMLNDDTTVDAKDAPDDAREPEAA